MKRYLIAGITAVTLAGAALAFANTLTVTSDTLGSGTTEVANPSPKCAPDVSYTTAWDAADQTFEVTKVTVTGADCNGLRVQAALVKSTGATMWSSPIEKTFATGTASWDIDPTAIEVDAALVTNAYATVTG
jgi:hypothetical protein